jgi:TonB family protein
MCNDWHTAHTDALDHILARPGAGWPGIAGEETVNLRALAPAAILVLALHPAAVAQAQERRSVPPLWGAPGTVTTLEDVDAAMEALKFALWNPPPALVTLRGAAGESFEQDLAAHILTDPTLKRFGELHAQLAASHGTDSALPAAALEPLKQIMLGEACRMTVLRRYWGGLASRDYHDGLVTAIINHLPEGERQGATARLQVLQARVTSSRAGIAPGMQSCASGQELVPSDTDDTSLLDDYNRLRGELAARVDAARNTAGMWPESTKRTTPCPAPPASTTAGNRLQIRKRGDPAAHYPAEARNLGVTGAVRMRLEYDATGCVIAVAVFSSSGVKEIDQAAINLAFETELDVPEIDGKRQGGAVIQPMTFSLLDPEFFLRGAGAAQPQP